ncbi:MAG TPA: acyl-CoA dehydrogenase family protein [Streptosporangiaceae bacterium]
MFIDLTPDQLALRDELRAYFSGLISPAERAALLTERHGSIYRDVVRRMGRDGWLGVGWPVRYGGRGFGQVEQQIFANEAARADVPLPAVTLHIESRGDRRAARRGGLPRGLGQRHDAARAHRRCHDRHFGLRARTGQVLS